MNMNTNTNTNMNKNINVGHCLNNGKQSNTVHYCVDNAERRQGDKHQYMTFHNGSKNRKVYLSNIENLQDIRYALSYSKAMFKRRAVKLSRDIGK